MALACPATRRRLPPIDPHAQSAELQRLSEAVGRASHVFGEVDQAFRRAAVGQEHPDREELWRRAAEFRRVVDEVRSHAAAIHDEERRRSEQRWASIRELLEQAPGPQAPTRRDDGGNSEMARELEGATATAEDRFKAAQHAFKELRAAHDVGQPGDLQRWRQSVADFRTAMVDVHRLTEALRHTPPQRDG
jgi:hypothetical protein